MAKKEIVSDVGSVNNILSSYSQDVVKGIRACVDINESVILIGETGTGKTTLINELAKEKSKVLHRVSVNGSMGIDEILGKWLAKDGSTYWIDGILTKAVRNGDWVVFDEMNAMLPEMGFALHSLLDDAKTITLAEKDGELVTANEEFRFFASVNPSEDYAGTKDVNLALMSRFAGVFYIDVFLPEEEVKVLERNLVETTVATKLVNLAHKLREMRAKGDMYTFVSTRDIIQAGKLVNAGLAINHAIQYSIFNKFTKEEKEDIISKDIITGMKAELPETTKEKSLNEEVKKLTKSLKELDTLKESEKLLKKELYDLKANPLSALSGLDPKTAQLLKTLGVLK